MHSSARAHGIIMHIISGRAHDVTICIIGKPIANSVYMHTREGYACKPARIKYGLSIGRCWSYVYNYYLYLTVRLYKTKFVVRKHAKGDAMREMQRRQR